MNCPKCGSPLTAQDQFCKVCGTPNNAGAPVNNAAPVQNNAMPATNPAVPTQPAVAPVAMGAAPAQPAAAKSGGKGGLYAIICVAILAVAAVVIFVVALNAGLIGGNGEAGEGEETGEEVAEVTTYKVTMGSWTFDIPANLAVEEYDGTLLLADLNDKSWYVRFAPIEGNIKYLNKAGLISAYQAQGVTVKNVQKTIDGYNFESFELSAGGDTAIMAYADLNGNYVMAVQAIKTTGELAYDKISVVTKIMKTASYNVSTNMEAGSINGFATPPTFNQQ